MSDPGANTGNFQPFPNLNAPLAEPGGQISRPWYRLLISLWQRTGGGGVPANGGAYLQLSPPDGDLPLGVYRTSDNELVADFANSAFIDTTDASNITSGTLASARLPKPLNSETDGTLLGRSAGLPGPPMEIKIGSNLTLINGTLSANAGASGLASAMAVIWTGL